MFLPSDEHADASEGGSDVIEPAELRQRLQQQQPPGRHPGLITGVDLVITSKRNTGISLQEELFFFSPRLPRITGLSLQHWTFFNKQLLPTDDDRNDQLILFS